MYRRRMLVGSGVAVSTALAGCSDEASEDDPGPESVDDNGDETDENDEADPDPEPVDAAIEEIAFSVDQGDNVATFDAGEAVTVDVEYQVGVHDGEYEATVEFVAEGGDEPLVETGDESSGSADDSEYTDTSSLEFGTSDWSIGSYKATVSVEDKLGGTSAEEEWNIEATDPLAEEREQFNEYIDAAQGYIDDAIGEFDGDTIVDANFSTDFSHTIARNEARPAYDELDQAEEFIQEEELVDELGSVIEQCRYEVDLIREIPYVQNHLATAFEHFESHISAVESGLSNRSEDRKEDMDSELRNAEDVLDDVEGYYEDAIAEGEENQFRFQHYSEKIEQAGEFIDVADEYQDTFSSLSDAMWTLEQASNLYSGGSYNTAINQTHEAENELESVSESIEAVDAPAYLEDEAVRLIDEIEGLLDEAEEVRSDAAEAEDENLR